jgi:hypothetical protein
MRYENGHFSLCNEPATYFTSLISRLPKETTSKQTFKDKQLLYALSAFTISNSALFISGIRKL